jgi:hypothetical protein
MRQNMAKAALARPRRGNQEEGSLGSQARFTENRKAARTSKFFGHWRGLMLTRSERPSDRTSGKAEAAVERKRASSTGASTGPLGECCMKRHHHTLRRKPRSGSL